MENRTESEEIIRTPEEEQPLTDTEKLAKYEELLTQIMEESVGFTGEIKAISADGRVRVLTDGKEIISHVSPDIHVLEIGDHVIVIKGQVVESLPKDLETQVEELMDFTPISWKEIGGIKSQLVKIRETIEFPLKYGKYYREFNLKPSKGILLYGPPGCGKTMIAKAIASYLLSTQELTRRSFVYLKGGELLSKYVGVTENAIKDTFEACREYYHETNNRAVIFIDEAEAILPVRGSRKSSDVETTIVPAFLSEMDGFSDNNPFVLLATNFASQIDPAVQRPGRIDLKVSIGRPDKIDSTEIFEIYLRKTKVIEDIPELAYVGSNLLFKQKGIKETVSGSLISNIVDRATQIAIKRKIANPSGVTSGVVREDLIQAITDC